MAEPILTKLERHNHTSQYGPHRKKIHIYKFKMAADRHIYFGRTEVIPELLHRFSPNLAQTIRIRSGNGQQCHKSHFLTSKMAVYSYSYNWQSTSNSKVKARSDSTCVAQISCSLKKNIFMVTWTQRHTVLIPSFMYVQMVQTGSFVHFISNIFYWLNFDC